MAQTALKSRRTSPAAAAIGTNVENARSTRKKERIAVASNTAEADPHTGANCGANVPVPLRTSA
jgi:hypothetical protein